MSLCGGTSNFSVTRSGPIKALSLLQLSLIMDNQFRRKPGEESYEAAPSGSDLDDDSDVIDLYGDFKDPNAGKLDPEVEELKLMAQSDALKLYGWVRKSTAGLRARFSGVISWLQGLNKKLVLVTASVVIVGLVGFKVVPGLISRLTGDGSGILGSSTDGEPSFPVLQPEASESTVFDDEVGVAITRDQINGVAITISQQVLPEDIKNGTNSVDKLALSLDDKASIDRLETDKGQIYIVKTTANTNTVLFAHEDRLIFIRSIAILDHQDWVAYVNALR